MRATFVYANSRRDLLAGVERGDQPDTALYGAWQLRDQGIDVRFHDPLLTRRTLPAWLDRAAWNLREVTTPYEVGSTDVLFTPLAALLPLAARGRRLPVVVMNFGFNLIWRRASRARRALLGASLRSAARVICLGESQRSELLALAGLDPERVVTMLVPVDTQYFEPRGVATGRTVLSVGKDLARDYATFIEAVGPLDAAATLVSHPRNVAELEVPANTTLRGNVPWSELRELYAGAACVVLPQRADDYPYGSEGGGLTALLEAMAMGRPIVASERAILRDYVEDGVEALLVPAEDPEAMREAIERVLADPELARSLGTAARTRVERANASSVFAAGLAPLLRAVV
jgi:glycosyltransferase involved in cell wall biosynthesis